MAPKSLATKAQRVVDGVLRVYSELEPLAGKEVDGKAERTLKLFYDRVLPDYERVKQEIVNAMGRLEEGEELTVVTEHFGKMMDVSPMIRLLKESFLQPSGQPSKILVRSRAQARRARPAAIANGDEYRAEMDKMNGLLSGNTKNMDSATLRSIKAMALRMWWFLTETDDDVLEVELKLGEFGDGLPVRDLLDQTWEYLDNVVFNLDMRLEFDARGQPGYAESQPTSDAEPRLLKVGRPPLFVFVV